MEEEKELAGTELSLGLGKDSEFLHLTDLAHPVYYFYLNFTEGPFAINNGLYTLCCILCFLEYFIVCACYED